MAADVRIKIPAKIERMMAQPSRGKILHGGRGSSKSWSLARAAIGRARQERLRILCTREIQSSVRDSVHRLLSDQIHKLKLTNEFDIQRDRIIGPRGSEFIFKGLKHNLQEIKSTEGIDVCWVEEARNTSEESWRVLRPTIRGGGIGGKGSEIWVSLNPELEDDPTMKLIKHPPEGWLVEQINWRDNPWFGGDLEIERRTCERDDPDAYDWIWEGHCRKISEAAVFRHRVTVEDFEEPRDARPFYGLDFGFADDPAAANRMFILEEDGGEALYITHEAHGLHVELDDLPAFLLGGPSHDGGIEFEGLPGVGDWPLKADASAPATISYIRRKGLNISAAKKWAGSIEDGVTHLKGFRRIVIHPRCTHTAREFRLYSYKTDPRQLDERGNPVILPILIDRWNHHIDCIRYALDGYITQRGALGVWRKLAENKHP